MKKKIKIPLNKENIETMNNFFEMNKKGEFEFSEKKQKDFLRKIGKDMRFFVAKIQSILERLEI